MVWVTGGGRGRVLGGVTVTGDADARELAGAGVVLGGAAERNRGASAEGAGVTETGGDSVTSSGPAVAVALGGNATAPVAGAVADSEVAVDGIDTAMLRPQRTRPTPPSTSATTAVPTMAARAPWLGFRGSPAGWLVAPLVVAMATITEAGRCAAGCDARNIARSSVNGSFGRDVSTVTPCTAATRSAY